MKMQTTERSKRTQYYNDGITKITDPFWEYICPTCNKSGWSLTYMDHCPECNSPDAKFTNSGIKNSPSSPLKRAGKSADMLTKSTKKMIAY